MTYVAGPRNLNVYKRKSLVSLFMKKNLKTRTKKPAFYAALARCLLCIILCNFLVFGHVDYNIWSWNKSNSLHEGK